MLTQDFQFLIFYNFAKKYLHEKNCKNCQAAKFQKFTGSRRPRNFSIRHVDFTVFTEFTVKTWYALAIIAGGRDSASSSILADDVFRTNFFNLAFTARKITLTFTKVLTVSAVILANPLIAAVGI